MSDVDRLDRLENILIDLVFGRQAGESLKVGELRQLLVDSGVISNE